MRPLRYFFTNGAQLHIENGDVSFIPAQSEGDTLPYTEKIPEKALLVAPEGISQNSKAPNATTLSSISNGPHVIQTPPSEAVPITWKDQNGTNKIAFFTQDGHVIDFSESLSKNNAISNFHPVSLSYHILSNGEGGYTILANVGKNGESLNTSRGYPWIINSDGTSRVLNFEIPSNFVFTYDETLRKAFFEKGGSNKKLLEVAIDSGSFSHASKHEISNWERDKKYRPKFCVVLNQRVEWVSDTQGRVVNVNNNIIPTHAANNPTPNAKPRAVSPMPEVQTEAGSKKPVDKVVFEFARKYDSRSLPDYGFQIEDFRPLAVSLFSDPAGSMVVTGEAGGGKTTYVEGFIRAVLNGDFADKGVVPGEVEIIRFSASALTSGTTLRGAEEARVEAILKYAEWAKANGKTVIFFVDEIHTLTQSGNSNHDGNDVFQSFLSHLADGTLKMVGTSTNDGYLTIASRGDLDRRLPALPYKPIPLEEVPGRLEKWINAYNKPNLSPKMLAYIADVANEFDSSGEPISRAARLLSRIYTEASFDKVSMENLEANPQYVLDVAARFYGYNIQNFTLDTLDSKLSEIDEKFSKIVGFDTIKDKIKDFHIRTVTRTRLSTKAEGRFLFISPKGLGKTTTVAAVADALGRPFVRLALSAYTDKEMLYADIARAAKKNPYSVILFDELGDAPREIIAALNSALDAQKISADLNYGNINGRHTKTAIDLGRTLMFAATNTGASLIEEAYKKASRPIGFTQPAIEQNGGKVEINIEELKKRAVAEGLLESLVDRFEVMPVLYYSEEEFRLILTIHYEDVFQKLNKRNQLDVKLEANKREAFIDQLMKKHFTTTSSPRNAIEEIEKTVENYYAYLATKERAPTAAAHMAKSCKAFLSE